MICSVPLFGELRRLIFVYPISKGLLLYMESKAPELQVEGLMFSWRI